MGHNNIGFAPNRVYFDSDFATVGAHLDIYTHDMIAVVDSATDDDERHCTTRLVSECVLWKKCFK